MYWVGQKEGLGLSVRCYRMNFLANPIHTTIFKMNNLQQGPTIQHEELCSILRNHLNGKRI